MGNSNSSPTDPDLFLCEVNKIKRKFPNDKYKNIYRLIAENNNRRNLKSKKIIYRLKDILANGKDPNIENKKYSIIHSKKNYKIKYNSDKAFKAKLMSEYPVFKNVNFQNIMLAGEGICDLLGDIKDTKINIYTHGLSDKEARNNTTKMINAMIEYCIKNKKEYSIVKTEKLVKFYYDIQFIAHRCNYKEIHIVPHLYESPEDILYKFDIGSSSVGFDGSKLYFSLTGKYAFTNNMNIVVLDDKIPQYEHQLLKYSEKGFNFILPFVRSISDLAKRFSQFGDKLLAKQIALTNFRNKICLSDQQLWINSSDFLPENEVKTASYTNYDIFNNIMSSMDNSDTIYMISKNINKELENKIEYYQTKKMEKYTHVTKKQVHDPKTNKYVDVKETICMFEEGKLADLLKDFNPKLRSNIVFDIYYANENYKEIEKEQISYLIDEISLNEVNNVKELLMGQKWISVSTTYTSMSSNLLVKEFSDWYKIHGYNHDITFFDTVLYRYYEDLIVDSAVDKNSKVVTFYGYEKLSC